MAHEFKYGLHAVAGLPEEINRQLLADLDRERARRQEESESRRQARERLRVEYLEQLREVIGEPRFMAYAAIRERQAGEIASLDQARESSSEGVQAAHEARVRHLVELRDFIAEQDIEPAKVRGLQAACFEKTRALDTGRSKKRTVGARPGDRPRAPRGQIQVSAPYDGYVIESDANSTNLRPTKVADCDPETGIMRHESRVPIRNASDSEHGWATILTEVTKLVEVPSYCRTIRARAWFRTGRSERLGCVSDEYGWSESYVFQAVQAAFELKSGDYPPVSERANIPNSRPYGTVGASCWNWAITDWPEGEMQPSDYVEIEAYPFAGKPIELRAGLETVNDVVANDVTVFSMVNHLHRLQSVTLDFYS